MFYKAMKDTHDIYSERTERKEKNECGESPRFGKSECSHGREYWAADCQYKVSQSASESVAYLLLVLKGR